MTEHKNEIVVLGATPEVDAEVLAAASQVGAVVTASLELARYRDLPPPPSGVPDPVVLVFVDGNAPQAFKAVQHLATTRPDTPVVVLSASNDSNQVLQAMRAGARDYAILEPDLADLTRAIDAMVEGRRAAVESRGPSGAVVSVLGAKGGVGATAIAANLAGMARRHRGTSTVLLDVDLELGDCLSFLDLECRATLVSAIRNLGKLDAEMLRGMLSVHTSSGLHVLAQAEHLEEVDEVTPEKIARLISFLKHQYALTVIDGIRPFDDSAITALDASDRVLLVLTPDVPSVKNARRCLSILERIAYPEERVALVLNRYDKRSKLDPGIIADTIGRPIDATIGNDFPSTIEAINRGVLLEDTHAGARVTRDLVGLVELVLGPDDAAVPIGLGARLRSWLSSKANGKANGHVGAIAAEAKEARS